jgi:hypothetical protein
MVRQRVSDWSCDRDPEDNALALLALGLVPDRLRTDDATGAEILAALRDVLAQNAQPAHWVLDAKRGEPPAWEQRASCEELAAVVREALPHGREVGIECGDALDPDDVLYFFQSEPDTLSLRANGWTFTSAAKGD